MLLLLFHRRVGCPLSCCCCAIVGSLPTSDDPPPPPQAPWWDPASTTAVAEDVSPRPSPNRRPDHGEPAPFTIPRDETKKTLSTFPSDVVVIVCGSTLAPISHPPRYDDCLVTTSNDSILRTLLPPRAGELLLLSFTRWRFQSLN